MGLKGDPLRIPSIQMTRKDEAIPCPPTPYRIHAGLTFGVGLVALQYCNWEPSRAHPVPFLIGVMSITLAFILGLGVFYGWRGFGKRFGKEGMLAYWELFGTEWEEHMGNERKKILGLRKFIWVGPLVSAVVLGLVFSDGKVRETLPFAIVIGALIALAIGVVIVLRLHSLKRDRGHVWFTEKGVMVNGSIFFSDGYGMMMRSCGVREEDGRHVLSIRYEVRSGRTVGEHEMPVPVPEQHVALVAETARAWLAGR
jgi:hypothetical protein